MLLLLFGYQNKAQFSPKTPLGLGLPRPNAHKHLFEYSKDPIQSSQNTMFNTLEPSSLDRFPRSGLRFFWGFEYTCPTWQVANGYLYEPTTLIQF